MQHWETIKTASVDGFDIVLSFAPEDTHPRDCFDDSIDDIQQLCKDIDSGRLIWFVARVEAHKNGICLASDYLGGCLYSDAADFIAGGYYDDMVQTAISDARNAIEQLAA